jgi:diguanylate cyclase (GGDEF)-like protein/PAS domain S-box-containing protein
MWEASPAAMALLDARGVILYATPATARLLGVEPARLAARSLLEFVDREADSEGREFLEALSRPAAGQRERQLQCRRPDGTRCVLGVSWTNGFADRAIGAAVVSLRDLTEIKRAAMLQSALYRIAALASSVEEMSAFYASVHAIVGELLDARNFFIAIYDPVHDMVDFPYFVDESDDSPEPMRPGRSLTGYVLRTGRPLFVTEETFNEMAARGEVELVGAPSADWLGVPLKIGEATIGVLAVQSYVPTSRYVESEKAVLTFVSHQVAAALEHKRAVEALRASEERYRQLFARNLAGVFRSTADGRLLDCNDAFVRLYGYGSREELLATSTSALYETPEDRSSFLKALKANGTLVNQEGRARRRDGSIVWTLENVTLLPGVGGEVDILEGTIIDITARKRAEEQIQHLAFHDALTGLPNRALFDDRLAFGLAHCRREGSGLAVLFLDLDHFKGVNDSLGHDTGDRLLRAVAARLRAGLREEDTVARVGGDEFLLLLHGVCRETDARLISEKIRAALSEPFPMGDRTIRITASIGVSLFPDHGAGPESLIRSADAAMYAVKAGGRNACRVAPRPG